MTTATVLAAGDLFLNMPDGRTAFRALTPLLSSADIVFANCEGVYSDHPQLSPSRKHFMGAPTERGSMLADMPLHVMTCANNHMIDGGYSGMRDTAALLRGQGIAVTGIGETIDEATSPAIIERAGLRIAFLGFCSVFPVGYEARPDRPGLAALRVRTYYTDPDPNFWEPEIDPIVTTLPDPGDLERFRSSIEQAREAADIVIVACHWGYSSRLELLHDYETSLARDAVEHGADAVVCHHQHSLRGIEIHRGRPIYYGLGALIHHFERMLLTDDEVATRRARFGKLASFGSSPDYPMFPFDPKARMTGLASLDVDGTDVHPGFHPAYILGDGSTEPLRSDDERASHITDYLEHMSHRSGFDTTFQLTERHGWALIRVGTRKKESIK